MGTTMFKKIKPGQNFDKCCEEDKKIVLNYINYHNRMIDYFRSFYSKAIDRAIRCVEERHHDSQS